MKKNYLKLMAVLFAATMSTGMISCGDDDDNETQGIPDTPITPVDPTKDDAMSSAKQKEYLETVALEFMDKIPSSDYRDIVDLCMYLSDTYGDSYDWSDVSDWAEDAFKAAREALGTQNTESKTEKRGSYTYNYNYIYTEYQALLIASNFTGRFTASNGKWTRENDNDLLFVFTDKHNQQCVLKIETGGSIKKVHALELNDRKDADYESNGYTYTRNYYYDRTKCTIGVPERIVVTLTQGNSQVVKTTVQIDLGSISGEEFDISKNSLTLSVLTELSNGYRFDASKVAYTANSNASVSFTMSKNGTSLIAMGASADVNGLPSVNVSAFSGKDFDEDDYDLDNTNGKNVLVKLDILGKVQIQGKLADVRKFANYMEEADYNYRDEKNYKSYIGQANALADINLFYDGKNVKQAAIKLEPFACEKWDGTTYWEAEPVICFYDGTSYSTFEAFFNEKDFKNTIDAFKTLANKYAELQEQAN